jgi:hypothetical protein
MQANDQPEAEAPPQAHMATLTAVRQRGAFVATAIIWSTAVGGLVGIVGLLAVAANATLNAAAQFRGALGFAAPSTGPDWYTLGVFFLIVFIPTLMVGGLFRWYRQIWRDRLDQVWVVTKDRKRFSRIQRLTPVASQQTLDMRTTYLDSLLATPSWQALDLDGGDPSDGSEPTERYRGLAEAALKEIEVDHRRTRHRDGIGCRPRIGRRGSAYHPRRSTRDATARPLPAG